MVSQAAPRASASRRIPIRRARARLRAAHADLAEIDRGSKGWIRARVAGLASTLLLVPSITDIAHRDLSTVQRVGALAALGIFVGCFIRSIWVNAPSLHHNRAPYSIIAALLVGIPLVALLGSGWLAVLSICGVVMLLFNCAPRWWAAMVLGIPIVDLIIGTWWLSESGAAPFNLALQVLLVGAVQAAFYRQVRAKVELSQARAELARMAVSEERLRIARDLHDILGQRLSAVSLKAELAARLVERDPAHAAAEMGEVAAVARAALADVRETVAGYRTTSLCGEIETARALLSAAGVRVTTSVTAGPLPTAVDACAACVVREAVTNVIRHAQAGRCTVEVRREAGEIVVEVRDDGLGAAGGDVVYGTGLTGLAERVAARGGALWTGVYAGNFAVRATFMPTSARALAGAAPDAAGATGVAGTAGAAGVVGVVGALGVAGTVAATDAVRAT